MIFFGSKPRNGIAGSYTTSMFNVSRKLHAVFHHGFTSYSPTKTVGRFHFLYVLYSIYSLQIFSMMAIVTSVRWELIEVLIGIDLIIIDMEYLPICFYYFTPCEYNLPLETGFLKLGPVWNSFAMIFPWRFLVGRCHFKALLDLWLLRALQHLFYGFPANSVHLQCRRLAGDLQETRVWSVGQEDPLVQEIATHSNILAWEIPWTQEPRRLQSMGSHRVRQDWVTKQQ